MKGATSGHVVLFYTSFSVATHLSEVQMIEKFSTKSKSENIDLMVSIFLGKRNIELSIRG